MSTAQYSSINNIKKKSTSIALGLVFLFFSLIIFISMHHLSTNISQILSEKASLSLQNNDKLIAHAGGSINGITRTNSLEVLNHNDQLGFKIFELDILKTSDNVYVAAHDWESWKK